MNCAVKQNCASITIFDDLKRLSHSSSTQRASWTCQGAVGGGRVRETGSGGLPAKPVTLTSPGSVQVRCTARGVCHQNEGARDHS